MCGKGTARCSRIRSDSGEGETWIMVISMSMNGGGIFFLRSAQGSWQNGATEQSVYFSHHIDLFWHHIDLLWHRKHLFFSA